MRQIIPWMLTCATIAKACDCSEPPPFCTRINQIPILFIGDVLDSNADGSAYGTQTTLQRVRIVEVFKGLPDTTKEVWVDPGSNGGCYAELPVGKRVLVESTWAGIVGPGFAAEMRNHRGERKPLPPGFDPKTSLVVWSGACSWNLATRRSEDIRFLQAWKAGTWRTRVDGLVSYSPVEWTELIQPTPGVRVRMSGTSGQQREFTTGTDGRFAFIDITPGAYQLNFEKPGHRFWGSSDPITVPEGGCGVRQVQAKADGKIRIRLTGPLARNILVSIINEAQVFATAATDPAGFATFSGLPAGTYRIAINPQGPQQPSQPYPATFYPDAIRLGINESKLNLSMPRPLPLPVRRVTVRVRSPDGKPVKDATVSIARGETVITDTRGIAVLRVLSGFNQLPIRAWAEFDKKMADGTPRSIRDWKRWVAETPLPGSSGDASIEIRFAHGIGNGDR